MGEGKPTYVFSVDSISPENLVLGRNHDHDIPVGAAFSVVSRVRVVKEQDGEYRTENRGTVGNVSLRVREVHWYGRTIDFVPGGHTAGLLLEGCGLERLALWLADLELHEYIQLSAE